MTLVMTLAIITEVKIPLYVYQLALYTADLVINARF